MQPIFNDIFSNFTQFQLWFNTDIKPLFYKNNVWIAEWFDETKMFSSLEILFFYLQNRNKNRHIRYSLEVWMGLFTNRFIDSSFDIYFKQQAFKLKNLDTIKDISKRDSENVTTSTGDTTLNNANTNEPFGGTNQPLTDTDNVSAKNQSINNLNTTVTTENYHIIDDFKNLISFRYRIGVDDFIESFNDLFRVIVKISINQPFQL